MGYPAKYPVRMVMANEQSEKIYSDYFGEPEDEVVQCKGYYRVEDLMDNP